MPDVFKNSVTWDQGGEMGSHKKFTMATGMPVAIADELNDRPRQTLGWLKPIEAFSKVLPD
ncbi:hypothetical protein [Amycolatopsis sp. NPDC102389]|uniref:hypothetical protein n=1 Tax=Amycolatopsis sp. NPDC102389 TaxID=3363941 RepID=UPI0037F76088